MKKTALLFLLVTFAAHAQRADTARRPASAPLLTPCTTFDGPVLDFDFPSMLIGTAEYDEGPTGVTVFHFPARVAAAVDVARYRWTLEPSTPTTANTSWGRRRA